MFMNEIFIYNVGIELLLEISFLRIKIKDNNKNMFIVILYV